MQLHTKLHVFTRTHIYTNDTVSAFHFADDLMTVWRENNGEMWTKINLGLSNSV
jgi:hypothetical protein